MEKNEMNNMVIEEVTDTNKKTKNKGPSRKQFWLIILVLIGLFILIFFLASQLTAGKKAENKFQGIAHEELMSAQARINNLADRSVSDSGEEGGSKSESYVNSIIKSNDPIPEPENNDLDLDLVLNTEPDKLASESNDSFEETRTPEFTTTQQKDSPKNIENEPSMIVFSRKGNASVETQSRKDNNETAESQSKEEGSVQKHNYAQIESPLQAIIYNDATPIRVFEGEYIEGEIINRIESGVADSPVIATVIKDFFDRNHRYVVIPAGSRVIGEAGSVVRQDQTRLILSFHRIILPNDQSVLVSKPFKGLAADGRMGVKSKVNEHLLKRYGSTLLFGVLSGLGAFAQNKIKQTSGASFFVDRASTNFEQINNHLFQQYSNISPTITVHAGHKVTIYISEDFMISPFLAIKERGYAK